MNPPRLPTLRCARVLSLALAFVWAVSAPGRGGAQPRDADATLRAVADRTLDMDLSSWDWDAGVALHGLMRAAVATSDARYADRVRLEIDRALIGGPPPITHPNHVAPGLAVLDLYDWTGEVRYLEAALAIGEAAMQLPRGPSGGFLHAPGELWVDTLYMTVPFLARLSVVSGDPGWLAEAANQYVVHANSLAGESLQRGGVWVHGRNDPAPGYRCVWRGGVCADEVSVFRWLRGNGWAAAAAVDLLDALPPEHPDRPTVAGLVAWQLAELAALQAPDGRWTTVVTRFDFYEETSGSALVGYALARGLHGGILGSEFAPTLEAVRSGVAAMVDPEGVVRGVSVGTGPQPTEEKYNQMASGDLQLWGQGATLLLLSEPADGFAIQVGPRRLILAPGEAARARAAVRGRWGVPEPAGFSLGPLPGGLAVDWPPSAVDEVAFSVRADPDAILGRRVVTIGAVASAKAQTVTLTVDVVARVNRVYLPRVLRVGVAQKWPVAASLPDDTERGAVMDGQFGYALRAAPGGLPRALRQPASHPRISSAATQPSVLAEVGLNDIGIWESAGIVGAWRRPLAGGDSTRFWPAPAPDGHSFVFVEHSTAGGARPAGCEPPSCPRLRIADVAAEGGGVAAPPLMPATQPDWSPVDDFVLFQGFFPDRPSRAGEPSQYRRDLFSVRLSDGAVYRLLSPPGWLGVEAARWSPNGRWIVTDDSRDITVIDRWGSVARRLWRGDPWISTNGADWSADGRNVLFTREAGMPALFMSPRVFELPWSAPEPRRPFPPDDLAESIWAAADAFVAEFPPAAFLPGYGSPASASAAAESIDDACRDWPDLEQAFESRVHPKACQVWVAGHLALFHAISAKRDTGSPEDRAWAISFLSEGLEGLADFVYGPETRPAAGYRDTRAAVWQNPQRAVDLLLAADLLRRDAALPEPLDARVRELASGVARAWDAAWWTQGVAPANGLEYTSGVAPAASIAGLDVGAHAGHYFTWDGDHGNTPAEEVAWLGAGTMVAARILQDSTADAAELYDRARYFASYAVAFDRADPRRGGTVRTLNSEDFQGADGQRRYWLENHFAEVPAVPYVASLWHSLGIGMLANGGPWPDLSPPEAWRALWGTAEETMRDGNGTMLVDFVPGAHLSFQLADHPGWVAPCGDPSGGLPFVRLDMPGGPASLSEIGHSAASDMLTTGVAMLRVADDVGDDSAYLAWDYRLRATLDEMTARPPDPRWARCKTAAYVSTNPGYHWSRILAGFSAPYLAASGYTLEPW